MFTVPEMAEFLFNNRQPESCAAALRLLRSDRLYFKQASAAAGLACLRRTCTPPRLKVSAIDRLT